MTWLARANKGQQNTATLETISEGKGAHLVKVLAPLFALCLIVPIRLVGGKNGA